MKKTGQGRSPQPQVTPWAFVVLFLVSLLLAIVMNPVSDLLSDLMGSVGLGPQSLFGTLLILCALALPLSFFWERETPIPQVVNWVAIVLLAVGMILVSADVFGWRVLYSLLLYGVLLLLFALALWFHFKGREPPISERARWVAAVLIEVGMILVLAGVFRWRTMVTVGCAILASIVTSVLGVNRGWWPISLRISEPVRERLDGWTKRIRAALPSLSRSLPAITSHRFARVALLLSALVIVIVGLIVLRYQILRAFNAFVSLASSFRQIGKEHEDQIVFTMLGLASFAVLLAVLITIVYKGDSRRLTAVVLAIAFLALVMFFCVYTGPAIVTETADFIMLTPAPKWTPTATPTNTPMPTISPTPTASVTAAPTSTSTNTPTPTYTPTHTVVVPTNTPTPVPPTYTPTPLPPPTQSQPTPTNTPLTQPITQPTPTNTPLTQPITQPTPTNTPLS